MLSIGSRANRKEDCHEKEEQKEIEGNVSSARMGTERAGKRKRPSEGRPLVASTIAERPGVSGDGEAAQLPLRYGRTDQTQFST
jgi:hypothetical protein